MKSHLLSTIRWLLVLSLFVLAGPLPAASDLERIAELHWHPATAEEARRMTVAAAVWLADEEADATHWHTALRAETLSLARSGERVSGQWAALGDGVFAWLVEARDHNVGAVAEPFPQPRLRDVELLNQGPGGSGRIGRLERVAALLAPEIWERLARRLNDPDVDDSAASIDDAWVALIERLEGLDEHDDSLRRHAAEQGKRTLNLAGVDDSQQRAGLVNRILLAQVEHDWAHGRVLAAVWQAFEALARLAAVEYSRDEAIDWVEWFESLEADQLRGLRRVDTDLPVIIALLEDAAGYLAASEPGASRAISELSDVYARLALFAPDMGFYLDQPVRSDIHASISACNPDPLLVGPMPREVYERCVNELFGLFDDGLQTEELTGGRQGPFAPEFLRRELGLVSWQRAAYIDGHLGWMLDSPCEPPEWVNVLEWSLMMEHLARWVPQRPVFFAGPRWQEVLADVQEQAFWRIETHQEWIDCLSGHGRERRDPVQRLLDRHDNALRELRALLAEADERFYAEAVRTGADIDLDGAAGQVTGYRPEGLMVRPCPQAQTCGARAELPVSRALLGLFPNAYLLADQLGMGEMGLCYEAVRWVERNSRPARNRDGRVANYEGRLSFELVGTFADESDEAGEIEADDTVFRYRLTASNPRHYLFAAADPELLELDCPRELIGKSVASSLPDDRVRLIPDRLTYFVSAPTTPEAELLANWDRGAEWRDWFVTGDRVEQFEVSDGIELEVAVQAELAALAARRERQLAAPLTTPVRADDADPIALAMVRVADSTAMLRRLMEIHYPRIIRHHDPIRGMFSGEAGLITRDRVRLLREEGIPMVQVPGVGLERSGQLREMWLLLPAGLRENGQWAPEVDYGFERMERLLRVSRYQPGVTEPPAER